MARGVNMDDIFLCDGYGWGGSAPNTPTDSESALEAMADEAISWGSNFVRVSLSMDGLGPIPPAVNETVHWGPSDASGYTAAMTAFIDYLASKKVYVLLTLRNDTTMSECQESGWSTGAACVPAAKTSAVYAAFVDSFYQSPYVIYGLANEPDGGNQMADADLFSGMQGGVNAIRAEESKVGSRAHLIATQARGATGDVTALTGLYTSAGVLGSNVIFEVHAYTGNGVPDFSSFKSKGYPIIMGEYGPGDEGVSADDQTFLSAFWSAVESNQIPNTAWDFEQYSDCGPDLLNGSDPTNWGTAAKGYLSDPANP